MLDYSSGCRSIEKGKFLLADADVVKSLLERFSMVPIQHIILSAVCVAMIRITGEGGSLPVLISPGPGLGPARMCVIPNEVTQDP